MWPHLRAAAVLFHLVAVLMLSLPSASIRSARLWRAPNVQREFEHWSRRARSLGWDVSPTEFEERLRAFTFRYLAARDVAIAPFEAYAGATGTMQGWAMFATPQTDPTWLTLEIRETSGDFRTIYRERSDSLDWMRRQLDHNRLRKLEGRLARGASAGTYRRLVNWLARRAAADFPEAVEMRARVERRTTPAPSAGKGVGSEAPHLEREIVVDLERFR